MKIGNVQHATMPLAEIIAIPSLKGHFVQNYVELERMKTDGMKTYTLRSLRTKDVCRINPGTAGFYISCKQLKSFVHRE